MDLLDHEAVTCGMLAEMPFMSYCKIDDFGPCCHVYLLYVSAANAAPGTQLLL